MNIIIDIALTLVAGLVILAFALAAGWVGLLILGALIRWVMRRWLHYATRNTAPDVGQAWHGAGGREYHVIGVNGHHVQWQTGRSGIIIQSWDRNDEWQARVRLHRLYLATTSGWSHFIR